MHPYSVDISVVIKKVQAPKKGVRAEVRITFSDQDPYSKKDKALGTATGGATVPTDNPDKGDTEAAVNAALQEALETVITGIQGNAKQP